MACRCSTCSALLVTSHVELRQRKTCIQSGRVTWSFRTRHAAYLYQHRSSSSFAWFGGTKFLLSPCRQMRPQLSTQKQKCSKLVMLCGRLLKETLQLLLHSLIWMWMQQQKWYTSCAYDLDSCCHGCCHMHKRLMSRCLFLTSVRPLFCRYLQQSTLS